METTNPTFEPHRIVWTREKAARFWDYLSRHPAAQDSCFSRTVGAALIDEVQRHGVQLRARRVLDYGCGPGYLLKELSKRGVQCEGADFSEAAVAETRHRMQGAKSFRGAVVLTEVPSSLGSCNYDLVFFVEAIEHVLEEDLPATLRELRRIVRPQGRLVVTTPNSERLEDNECLCPDCGAVYHRVQHVRAYDRCALSMQLAEAGFRELWCGAMTLRDSSLLSGVKALGARLLRRRPAHLIYIGTTP